MDETRPLLISHLLAASLGASWLALVYLTPPPPPSIALLRPEEAAAVEVQFDDEPRSKAAAPAAGPVVVAPVNEPATAEAKKARKEEQEGADAFGGSSSAALVGDVTNALRGVAVTKSGESKDAGGKAVIAYGQGGTSVRTPGRGIDPNAAAAGASIGRVNAAGSVTRASIAVAAPSVIRSADGGPSGRDMAKLGTFVRGRQAQLQYCYQSVGLAANPALAGSINVNVSLDPAGTPSEARVMTRTWSGPGSAEAEACILQRVQGWVFPPSTKSGAESYSFSFIFNR